MTEKKFASQADLEEKKISWEKLSDNAYAYTAEGDPNTGVIIGDDGCMIIDATATPVAAPPPDTSRSRSRSNGRLAFSGSSSRTEND